MSGFTSICHTLPDGRELTSWSRPGSGPERILIPGTWGDLQSWTPLITRLPPDRAITVIELFWQGGRVLLEGRLDIPVLADAVQRVIDALQPGPFMIGRLHLNAPQPHAELLARDARAGQRALIPLRHDLTGDLRDWLDGKLEALRDEAEEKGTPLPLNLPAHEPLFSVPRNLIKSFNLDLAAAGIEKEDERGRTVDLHALRHTFGTHLSKNGVAPRTAQAALRHSSLDLTMNPVCERSEQAGREAEG